MNCYKDFMEWLDEGVSTDTDVSKTQNENEMCEGGVCGYRLKIPGSAIDEVHPSIESLIYSATKHNLIENRDEFIIKRCLRMWGRHRGFSRRMEEYLIEEIREKGEI